MLDQDREPPYRRRELAPVMRSGGRLLIPEETLHRYIETALAGFEPSAAPTPAPKPRPRSEPDRRGKGSRGAAQGAAPARTMAATMRALQVAA